MHDYIPRVFEMTILRATEDAPKIPQRRVGSKPGDVTTRFQIFAHTHLVRECAKVQLTAWR